MSLETWQQYHYSTIHCRQVYHAMTKGGDVQSAWSYHAKGTLYHGNSKVKECVGWEAVSNMLINDWKGWYDDMAWIQQAILVYEGYNVTSSTHYMHRRKRIAWIGPLHAPWCIRYWKDVVMNKMRGKGLQMVHWIMARVVCIWYLGRPSWRFCRHDTITLTLQHAALVLSFRGAMECNYHHPPWASASWSPNSVDLYP